MKVFFVTEGGRHIGFGHITRCVSLCQAFEEKGVLPDLIVNGDKTIEVLLKDENYKIFNWLEKKQVLFNVIKGADVIIIDSYLADHGLYNEVSEIVDTVVCVDDNNRISYPKGIVINGNIYAKKIRYPENKDITYLLGVEYAFLRKEFRDAGEKKIKKDINNILLIFGGEDRRDLTVKVLDLLKNTDHIKKNVVIGRGYRDLRRLDRFCNVDTEFVFYPGTGVIRNMMLDADISISAGGQTMYELACLGVPTIVIAVADNQLNNVTEWEKTGFSMYAGLWNDSGLWRNIEHCIEELRDKDTRSMSSNVGKKLVTGNGAVLAADAIIEIFDKKALSDAKR